MSQIHRELGGRGTRKTGEVSDATNMDIRIRLLGENFGAEVSGIELREITSDAVHQRIAELVDEYQLVVLRGQEISKDAHLGLMEGFGPLFDEVGDGRGWSLVSNVDAESPPTFRQTRLLFHQDYNYSKWPVPFISLYGSELVGEIVPTVFASNWVGYLSLADADRASFSSLVSVHAYEKPPADVAPSKADQFERYQITDMSQLERYRRTVQPVIRVHPRTGRPLLYCTEQDTSHILGLDSEESERVIHRAWDALYREGNLYEHQWELNDLVIWDNLSVQHARGAVNAESRRTMRRVVVSERSREEIYAGACDL
jgi:taurine dioxygenase